MRRLRRIQKNFTVSENLMLQTAQQKAEITIRLCLRTSFADLPKRIPALLLLLLQ